MKRPLCPTGKAPPGTFFAGAGGLRKKRLTWSALQDVGWKQDENSGALRAFGEREKCNGEKDNEWAALCLEGPVERGALCAGGVWDKDEVKGLAHIQAAYRMGKTPETVQETARHSGRAPKKLFTPPLPLKVWRRERL